MVKYRMNLVKSIRKAERRSLKHAANMVLMMITCFVILGAAGYYVYGRITLMESTIAAEKQKVKELEAEYRNYQVTQSTIDKADVELLDQLLSNRVYWTRTLEAMAKHLPDKQPTSYWITKFGFRGSNFTVGGYGYITERQEQLLALDEYLTNLRNDANYTESFSGAALRSAVRSDETGRAGESNERVSFEYVSVRKGGGR